MFLNCLQWMAVPSVSDIYILVPNSRQSSSLLLLAQENASYYGQRIRHWHEQPNHPVHLVFGTSLGEALSLITPPSSAAVLWTTANQEFRGNAKGLQQGFAQWKRQPAVPVVAAVWQFQYYNHHHETQQQQHYDSRSFDQDSNHNQTIRKNSSNSDNHNISNIPANDNWVPLPELRRVSAWRANPTVAYNNNFPNNTHSIPLHPSRLAVWFDLSVATFLDWNYLCFLLQHRSALNPLWQKITDPNLSWKAARLALEAWLSLVTVVVPPSATNPSMVEEESLVDVRRLHDIRFFDTGSSSRSGSGSTKATKQKSMASQIQVLDKDMRDIVSLFGGIPPVVADDTVASRLMDSSSRRPMEDNSTVRLDRIVC